MQQFRGIHAAANPTRTIYASLIGGGCGEPAKAGFVAERSEVIEARF